MVGARQARWRRRTSQDRRRRGQLLESRTRTFATRSLTGDSRLTVLALSRREALAALAATTALPLVAASAMAAPASEAQARALLDSIGENLLRLEPDGDPGATALGIDTGPRAALRSMLSDSSAAAH